MKKFFSAALCLMLLLFLLLCPVQAFSASCTGLHLWFDTLIPTLLPFMILSGILIQADLVRPLTAILSPLMHLLLGLSPSGTYVFLTGFLCGYPMGAKAIGDLLEKKRLSHNEAEYLLGFCNNASPAFLITYLVHEQLHSSSLVFPILFILYGAPLTYAALTSRRFRSRMHSQKEARALGAAAISFSMIDSCILDAVSVLVRVGCYIILFSLLSGAIGCLPIARPIKACITAALEITTGIPALVSVFPKPFCLLFLLPFTSFGGLCALAQTNSVIKNARLSIWKYVRIKLIISVISFLYTLILLV